jgi:hypothetical protein
MTVPTGPSERPIESVKDGVFSFSYKEADREWTKNMEREFRALALLEARDTLTYKQTGRLDELGQLRDRFLDPRTPEEVLLQVRRDRLLEKISENLQEYVKFQEGANRSRRTSS